MISRILNILSNEEIDYILNLPAVINAKNNIDNKLLGSIYFNIDITESIKNKINEKLGLNLVNNIIPMRWIKGDTIPHIDKGVDLFNNTYLIYLTDSTGELLLDNKSYPIFKNSAYIFNEGIMHETINTGIEPRLLLGPMNELGLSVGLSSLLSGPGGTSIYIRQSGSDIQYSSDNVNWINIYTIIDVMNTDTTLGFLKIIFTTNITFTDINNYFICNSDKIQFGSESLNNDGTRPIITIDGITNYTGLIHNSNISNPCNYIYIFNLDVRATNGSTLDPTSGWIGNYRFGREANNNYIINCSSDGDISDNSGGIVGGNAAVVSGVLHIINCSSSGNIGVSAGGIVGYEPGSNGGTINCISCWSTGGIIGDTAGGIVGANAANKLTALDITINITNCYSYGVISGAFAGGIVGSNPGLNGGIVNITNCYSIGSIIGNSSGGIVGSVDNGNITITNCYTTGNTDTNNNAGAISGPVINGSVVTIAHCYTTGSVTGDYGYFIGGSGDDLIATCYSEAYNHGNGWNSINANNVLTGVPITSIGTTWISKGVDIEYELFNMGYNPYNINNISISGTPSLIRTEEFTINKNSSTSGGVKTSGSPFYAILEINNTDGTITIDPATGVISTTDLTEYNTYTIYIYNTGSYNITTLTLIVNNLPCLTEDTLVLTPKGYVNIKQLCKGDNVITSDNRTVEIIKIYKSHVIGNNKTYPCIIPKNGISVNYPSETFKISQYHLIKYNDYWICPALHFKLDKSKNLIKYYHIKLENYITDHLVINNGIIVESLGNHPSDKINNEYKKEHRLRLRKDYSKLKYHK